MWTGVLWPVAIEELTFTVHSSKKAHGVQALACFLGNAAT